MNPTPGPYPLTVTKLADFFVIFTNQGNHFAKTFDPTAARLISAAPELLAALEAALVAVRYLDDHEGAEELMNQVCDALKKARGGAK